MQESKQKEQFSIAYVHAIATVAGYKMTTEVVDDDSIDVLLASSGNKDTSRRPKLDAQLKCTSTEILKSGSINFPLSLKNYNDLRAESLVPRILIVVLIPKTVEEWITLSEEQLIMRKCAYWKSLKGEPDTKNISNITLHIPRENLLTPKSLKEMMGKISQSNTL